MRWFFPRRRPPSAARRTRYNWFGGNANNVLQADIIQGDVHFPDSAPLSPADKLNRAAERLAAAVQTQWRAEAAIRSLHRPDPVRLRWSSTNREVSSSAAADLRIQGDLSDVVDKFRALPTQQLVILGEPGAGKTVLALVFTLGLLADRTSEQPLPVLLTVSSWNPFKEHLDNWVARRLEQDYKALADRSTYGRNAAQQLVEQHRIIPVLDGLDELPTEVHAKAIEGIDRATAGGRPLVVACRSNEFQTAVLAGGTTLATAAIIEVQRVDVDDAIAFLSTGLPRTVARWEPVFAHLRQHPGSPLMAALSTPLMVSLARTVYAHPDQDPAELLDVGRFGDAVTIEHHLLDSFLPTIYTDQPAAPSTSDSLPHASHPYPPDQAQRWLGFLANHLSRMRTRDIAWWRLRRPNVVTVLAYATLLGCALFWNQGNIVVGFFLGASFDWLIERTSTFRRRRGTAGRRSTLLLYPAVLVGMFWFAARDFDDASGTLFDGLGFALLFALLLSSSKNPRRVNVRPLRGLKRIVLRRMALGFAVGCTVGMTLFLIDSAIYGTYPIDWETQIRGGLFFGFLGWCVVGLAAWLTVPPSDVDIPHPHAVLRRDRTSTLVWMLVPILAFEVLVLVALVVIGSHPDWSDVSIGLSFGLGFGLGLVARSAWVSSLVPRLWWAARGNLPWRLMEFLDDGHRRGVFRQVGAMYQFRHASLQDRLADASGQHARRDG